MIKFKKTESKTATQTPIANKIIETPEVKGMRLGVFHNAGGKYTAEVDFNFDDIQDGWKSNEVKLRNDLYKLNNIAYKMPANFEWAEQWYENAVKRAREFTKHYNSNLHNKLGFAVKGERYYTIPFTYFSYCPVTRMALLQISAPIDVNGSIDFYKNHAEIEIELDKEGARNLHYAWVETEE